MRRGSAASVCRSASRLGAALQRPRTGRALVDGKSPGAPSNTQINADHRRALAEVVEAGPVPAVDGVVRWRRKDLARWLLETLAAISLATGCCASSGPDLAWSMGSHRAHPRITAAHRRLLRPARSGAS